MCVTTVRPFGLYDNRLFRKLKYRPFSRHSGVVNTLSPSLSPHRTAKAKCQRGQDPLPYQVFNANLPRESAWPSLCSMAVSNDHDHCWSAVAALELETRGKC